VCFQTIALRLYWGEWRATGCGIEFPSFCHDPLCGPVCKMAVLVIVFHEMLVEQWFFMI
jgi:hypothetical protein